MYVCMGGVLHKGCTVLVLALPLFSLNFVQVQTMHTLCLQETKNDEDVGMKKAQK